MTTLRRLIGWTLLWAADLAAVVFGDDAARPSDTIAGSDERVTVAASTVAASLRGVTGFARFVLRVGGPDFRVTGTLRDGRFVPGMWWRERGADESMLGFDGGEREGVS
jgi:hypothetical protein